MSFEKPSDRSITFTCDGCGKGVAVDIDMPPGSGLFTLAWSGLQANGWTTQKESGKPWDHYCPGCQGVARERREAFEKRERTIERNRR